MKETTGECPDSGRTAFEDRVLDATFGAFYAAIPAAVGAAVYAFFWDGSWGPFWVAASVIIGVQLGLRIQIWSLKIERWRLRRLNKQKREEIAAMQERTRQARLERIRLQTLASQLKTELSQKEAYLCALRAENLEMERLMLQRKIEQEAREARRRLEIACAAIEADRLEATAWRMELTAKQLEIKLDQADLFESLSVIEDNAQDRIIAAYEQGFDHGQQGIAIPIKYLRHLRVVEDSA